MDFREINGELIDVDEVLFVSKANRYFGDRLGFKIRFKNFQEEHIVSTNKENIQTAWANLKKILEEKKRA